MAADDLPTLYHTDSSYYSMIARLALAESGTPYLSRPVDIHRRRENQAPWFARLNPAMTVPVLVRGDEVLPDSRLILEAVLSEGAPADPSRSRLLDDLYLFPVDQFTFSWLLRWNPVARLILPRKLSRIRNDMIRLAADTPDLAPVYRARAAVFEQRLAAFSGPPAARWTDLSTAADRLLDDIDRHCRSGDRLPGGGPLGGDRLGALDVVATVFLSRICFCRQERRIARRPAVAAYWARMRDRPGFAQADVWDRLRPGLLLRFIG